MSAKVSGQWTLGDLIDGLAKRKADDTIMFDFGNLAPTGFDSYRGFYEDVALGWGPIGSLGMVGLLRSAAQAAIGPVFTGYKGGDYHFDRDSSLWVSNYGRADGVIITGFEDCDYMTVVRTRWVSL